MSEQQYRVIADRDKGDDPQWGQVESGDRVWFSGPRDNVDRIERPVPTTDTRSQMERDSDALDELRRTPVPVEHPSLPTREQIAEVVLDGFHAPDGDHPSWWINPLATADAVLALIQNGAER